MKLFLVLLPIIGLSAAFPARNLQQDFADILEVIPLDKIREIANKYADDPEVRQIVKYLKSEEFHSLIVNLSKNPSWLKFNKFMLEQGIDVKGFVQQFFNLLEGFDVKTQRSITRGVKDLFYEIAGVIPFDELLLKINDKMENSADFQQFWEKVTSEEARQLAQEVRQLEEVQKIGHALRDMGLDVDRVLDLIYMFLGW